MSYFSLYWMSEGFLLGGVVVRGLILIGGCGV